MAWTQVLLLLRCAFIIERATVLPHGYTVAIAAPVSLMLCNKFLVAPLIVLKPFPESLIQNLVLEPVVNL